MVYAILIISNVCCSCTCSLSVD